MSLSNKGTDFSKSRLYSIDNDKKKIFFDNELKPRHMLFFNPEIEQGVDDIQGKIEDGLFGINGRWIKIAVRIKTVKNKFAKTAIHLAD